MGGENGPKPLFKSPVGASQIPQAVGEGWGWNNRLTGRGGGDEDEVVACMICGKKWEILAGGEGVTYMCFLGLEGVEDCCGAVLDILYRESGERFVEIFLKEFATNPDDPRFNFFRRLLPQILQEAQEKLRKCSGEVEQAQSEMEQLRIATQESRTREE